MSSFFLPGGPVGCLLVHGFGGSPGDLLPFGEYLNQHGCAVFGVDWGCCEIEGPEAAEDQWKNWYACTEQGYASLKHHADPIVLAGHSTGAVLALLLAKSYPVRGVICFAPISHGQLWLSFLVKSIKIAYPAVSLFRHVNRRVGYGFPNKEFISVENVRALGLFLRHIQGRFSDLQVPVQIYYGGKDLAVPRDSAVYLASGLSSTQAQLISLPSAGHMLMTQDYHHQVWEPALRFIQSSTGQVEIA